MAKYTKKQQKNLHYNRRFMYSCTAPVWDFPETYLNSSPMFENQYLQELWQTGFTQEHNPEMLDQFSIYITPIRQWTRTTT